MCVLFLSCTPAGAASLTAYISTSPSGDSIKTATDYEQEGMALMAQRDWNGLIALTDDGLALYPDESELMCLKAYALRKIGHFQESVDLLDVAIPLDPRPARFANRGYGLLSLGRTHDALADAYTAIALDSSYATGHVLKATALLEMGNLTGALEEADTAIALGPGIAHYWHIRGNVMDRMGNCTGAIESLERSVTLDNEYEMPWPGLTNASSDLAQVKARCSRPTTSPTPTQAAFPSLLVVATTGIMVWLIRK
ncbi:MAG: tetratricopeptide repeat protein [Methanolinea sp.]|nr:tetratricopeptide repeat protein [Methanolinea sp.]